MRALLAGEGTLRGAVACDEGLVDALIVNGLGPIAHHAERSGRLTVGRSAQRALLAADLTARGIAANRSAVIEAVLLAFEASGIRSALLKGASLAAFYPQHHWRVMSDVDLLVDADEIRRATDALRSLGFRNAYREPDDHWDDHHHAAPMRHPQRNVCIELHRALDSSPWFDIEEFHAPSLWEHASVDGGFASPTHRLEPTLELNYIAAHWYLHLIENPGSPGLQRALFDVTFMLRKLERDTDLFLTIDRLRFPTLLLLSVLARLDIAEVDGRVVERAVASGQVDGSALAYCATMIDRRVCNFAPPPRTLVMEVESGWLRLALENDSPERFHLRRFRSATKQFLDALRVRLTPR